MEFEVIDKELLKKGKNTVALMGAIIIGVLLLMYFIFERYERSFFRSTFFAMIVLFVFLIIVGYIAYLTRDKGEVRTNDKVVIDEKGFTYSGYQKDIFMAWEDIGLIAVRDEKHTPSFHILRKNICKEQSKYFLNNTNLRTNTRKTTNDYLYIQYAEGMLHEINKYYNKQIRNEYKLAVRGMYEA